LQATPSSDRQTNMEADEIILLDGEAMELMCLNAVSALYGEKEQKQKRKRRLLKSHDDHFCSAALLV